MRYKISVLYGSVRTNRQGIRAVTFISNQLRSKGFDVQVIDPMLLPLPFLDKMFKEYPDGTAPENMQIIGDHLSQSDGFIIVTGEYNHSMPPALKNLLDHYQKEYHYKPSGILSYSAGRFGGIRAAIQARITLAELGTPSIPTILSVPQIQKTIDAEGSTQEEWLLKQTTRFINEFEWYVAALAKQRNEGRPGS
ncbi:NADPH-dependent FMN reductase [Fulvivirga sedimenti]|uniref:NAD(P)H-dependent oxidoreductase n=1 Tax=Fulvivirga sedimenti TaxID=2879465 RepID=A0A9X1HVC5_9BACT|nr:NAD(P)H-dependent oxidoreductase [Fulvivirga sedimenti]MCA6074577.1 NAD(P)H-dependent oxidoreductase [Fulvivirga sedimenti]MCA6075754.1 NAD(P)H-dependent oxidoreductase [Fulvivirga sedimenti]MCA6076882.1 NAD(P)H-dependent oxidoreductase [Fulvivirga sedimenti]